MAMFGTLFRLVFWGGLALLIFPIDFGKDDTTAIQQIDQPGIVDTLFAARGVAEDLKGLCERQPDACDVGSATLTTIKERAKISVQALGNYLESQPTATSTSDDVTASSPQNNYPQQLQTMPLALPMQNIPVPIARPQYP